MSLGYLYDIILSPVNTEKTQKQQSDDNKFAFRVDKRATKEDIARAMKEIFGADVEKINIVNTKGKQKRYKKSTLGRRSDVKKAVVSVKKGQEINFTKLEDK
ncbi:MAG: 50S ribosomal protein L23 [Rickettsiales bacterium]|jgi:large subunit ribosomal protein L23|nr:50S ribosomal protein L23 [Rickettsiales bacterium]